MCLLTAPALLRLQLRKDTYNRLTPVQKLQVARRDLALEAALSRLEPFDLLVLDDITDVSKEQPFAE